MTTARIGIISDTHMPDRWYDLPQTVFDIFADVDLILHAGDIGELWVTDKLSRIAPVVAVHGNDETDAAQAAFPYMQVLTIAGHRLVLAHSHLQDWDAEMATRKEDAWPPKLKRLSEFATPHNATIVVYGHTHIAMDYDYEGIRLINPGALASGNAYSRMSVQSVAILELTPEEAPRVTHYDLKTASPFTLDYAVADGFLAAYAHFSEVFFTDDLMAEFQRLRNTLTQPERMQILEVMTPLLHECWYHGKEKLSLADVQTVLETSPEAKALYQRLSSTE